MSSVYNHFTVNQAEGKAQRQGRTAGRLAVPFVSALIVMLALGAAHSEVSSAVPAIGYWATFVLLLALRVVVVTIAKCSRA